MDWLANPTVIVGLIGLASALIAPSVAARIKRKENGRIAAQAAAAAAESQRIEAQERRLQGALNWQAQEIERLQGELREERAGREALEAKVRDLEKLQLRTAQKYDRVMATLLDEARQVRDQVREREEHDDVLPNIEKLVKGLRDARGDFFNGERIA